jgi:hypothetical protein
MRAQPFRRALEFMAVLAAVPVDMPTPQWIPSPGKGKGVSPRRSGHLHMKAVRAARKAHNRSIR